MSSRRAGAYGLEEIYEWLQETGKDHQSGTAVRADSEARAGAILEAMFYRISGGNSAM